MSIRPFWSLAALAAFAVASPARAFTPENGFWWNPQEPGSGLTIEIQDNFLALAAYVYAPNGQATWYTAQGVMSGNSRFTASLDAFTGGQCIGCAFRTPAASLGAGGPVSIEFLTESTANLTWGNRTMRIERFDFYLTRAAGDPKTEMMLGEWQIVMDLYDRGGNSSYQDYPFYGDAVILDLLDRNSNPDYYEGCRPTNTDVGRCTDAALRDHDAAGFYNAARNEHVIVVKDVPGAAGNVPAVYFAYFVTTGTYQFDGVVEIYNENQTVGDGPFYPVRGFRSASRNFVQNGAGPSAADPKLESESAPSLYPKLAARAGGMPQGLSAAEVKARYDIDVPALAPETQALIQHMQSK